VTRALASSEAPWVERYRWPLVAAGALVALDAFVVERLVVWHGFAPDPSFLDYVVGQGFDDHLAELGVAAVVYLGVLSVVFLPLGRRLGRRTVTATLMSVAVALHVAAVGIATFLGTASWFRHLPHGRGGERTVTFDAFYDKARAAFVLLYVVVLLVAAGCGRVFGRSVAGRGRDVALASLVATAGYLAITLPFVDYENSCYVGRPIVFASHCG
jgi:hypothetical protein